jgi:catechol 2,3-dioxygenase-like lactoylglutathione lyase family enzyme
MKLNQILIPVTDLKRSFDFYVNLGLEPIVLTDKYVRFVMTGNDSTLSIQVRDEVKPSGVEVCFEVEKVDEKVAELKSKGLKFFTEPVDQPWKWREAYLKDPDGNTIIIFHAGKHRTNPENKIKK